MKSSCFNYFSYVLLFVIPICAAKNAKKCMYVYSDSFDHCSMEEGATQPSVNRNRAHYLYKQEAECENAGVCTKIFNISLIKQQSFDEKILAIISDMLEQCCGKCGKYHLGEISENLSHLDLSKIELSDIVFPVLGRPSLTELYGFYFIPIFDVPGAYYFTRQKTEQEMANDLILGCLNMWSLFVICLLMAVISGFLIWAMETSRNKDEFPRPFHIGLFEGFWWSFISMTTVGYGDRAPKTPAGRIYAVIWILIGITITSIYIASLTSEIMAIRSPDVPNLSGRNIGGLKHRMHDATMVAQHGGILHDFDFNDTIDGVYDLMQKLGNKEIDGFLINKETYFYFSRTIEEEEKYKEVKDGIAEIHLVKAELEYKKEALVSGMLIRSRDHYDYFSEYFRNNWPQIQACDALHLNSDDKEVDSAIASHLGGGLFLPFLSWTLVILGVIVIFGAIYEVRRRFVERKRKKTIHETKPLSL